MVCKEELLGAVWPDVTVNDESLTQCISEIRRALGTEGRRIIKTVARRGYLIDVTIETVNGSSASRSICLGTLPPQNADPTTSKGALAHAAVDTTRRQISTLVCAFRPAAVERPVNSEDLREILAECHRRTQDAVQAHEGFVVARYFDGLMAIFGYPQPCEDDSERAVRTALAVMRSVRERRFEQLSEPLQVDVEIATDVAMRVDATYAGTNAFMDGQGSLLAPSPLKFAERASIRISART